MSRQQKLPVLELQSEKQVCSIDKHRKMNHKINFSKKNSNISGYQGNFESMSLVYTNKQVEVLKKKNIKHYKKIKDKIMKCQRVQKLLVFQSYRVRNRYFQQKSNKIFKITDKEVLNEVKNHKRVPKVVDEQIVEAPDFGVIE